MVVTKVYQCKYNETEFFVCFPTQGQYGSLAYIDSARISKHDLLTTGVCKLISLKSFYIALLAVQIKYIHTYIIGRYNPSGLRLMLCVLTLCMSSGTYSLTLTPNGILLRNFSWQFYLFLEFLSEIC